MNTCVRQNPFSATYMGITKCFCGKLTVEDHDFCFCSPECARADAMVSLGGEDSHYRKVVRKAYVRCGAPVPVIYKRKAEEKTPIAKHVPPLLRPANPTHQCNKQNIGGQNDESAKKEKVFPTLAQVTTAVLARKGKQGGEAAGETFAKTSEFAVQTLDALPVSVPPPLLNQQTRAGLDRGTHKSPLTRLRSTPQQTMPLKVDDKTVTFRCQPPILHPVAEARGRKNGNDAPPLRLDRRAEKMTIPPRSQLPVLPNKTAAICPPGNLRRSASFAGWHSPAKRRSRAAEEGKSIKELFDQLEDIRIWIEEWDGMPDSSGKLIG